jgi:hypothetical protein
MRGTAFDALVACFIRESTVSAMRALRTIAPITPSRSLTFDSEGDKLPPVVRHASRSDFSLPKKHGWRSLASVLGRVGILRDGLRR